MRFFFFAPTFFSLPLIFERNDDNSYIDPPFSLNGPSKLDEELTISLDQFLLESNLYEKEEGNSKRKRVLSSLEEIVQNWAKELSIKKGMKEEIANELNIKIFTFGSYRLGVHSSISDIDTLCITPNNITRDDFFDSLYLILKTNQKIKNLVRVREAFVPVMNFEFDGVQVFFSFFLFFQHIFFCFLF